MGEAHGSSFEPDFNRSGKVEFTDQGTTSNAGVLLLRKSDYKLNLELRDFAPQCAEPHLNLVQPGTVSLGKQNLNAMRPIG